MHLFAAATLFTLLHVAESIPLNLLQRADPSSLATLPTEERSQYDIIRSCFITIIACVWTSAHPNIAAPQDAGWKSFKRRFVTMIYALIAPEAIVMWALRQNIASKRIASDYNRTWGFTTQTASGEGTGLWTYLTDCCNDIKTSTQEWFIGLSDDQVLRQEGPWTKTHGLFIQMGGFVLYNNGRPVRVLSFKDFKDLRRRGMIDDPLVTERELKDRTKSDTLSKALVVLQTTWFVFQCAARWGAGLPLAELEVVTLGFAVLNAVTYAVWWNKPQDVLIAIAVPLKNQRSRTMSSKVAESGGSNEEQAELLSPNQSAGDGSSPSPQRMAGSMSDQGTVSRLATTIFRHASALLQPLQDMLSCRKIPSGDLRVPDFYADDKGRHESGKACTIACIVGTVFGALHALAWISSFSTHSELVSWRVSTLIITAEPVFMLIVGILYEEEAPPQHPSHQQQPHRPSPSFKSIIQKIFIILFALGTPLYIVARLTLIILALVSLRALPPDAFKVISWTSFIPHL